MDERYEQKTVKQLQCAGRHPEDRAPSGTLVTRYPESSEIYSSTMISAIINLPGVVASAREIAFKSCSTIWSGDSVGAGGRPRRNLA
jgi:hypothetical protein